MNENSVSIIIPTYNAEGSLQKCLDSVLAQELRAAEVILINDGSTDGTAAIAKSYGESITYLEQENAGQGAARNAGLSVANGSFVAFLDADDYWLPGFLEVCLAFLNKHPNVVVVNTGYIIKKWGGEYVGPSSVDKYRESFPNGFVLDNFFDFWGKYDHVRTGTVVIRREIIEKAGYQRADLRISQDLEYWGYIATFGLWGFIPEPLWVGDSASIAGRKGWIAKYRKRRSMCPSVEQWQKRIIPRLKKADWAGFRVVRGRVAGTFALNKILGGDDNAAKEIVIKYGDQMPANWSTNLMKRGVRSSSLGWAVTCNFIRVREMLKSSFLYAFPAGSQKIISLARKLKMKLTEASPPIPSFTPRC